ncbi:MATE family efflux transporter [Priestia flexa]|uniref:MATE family efflux transporter n=1 Tax=Priestia flexa TaxID=86664 RepID=UPI00209D8E86|nr:MATE family efflux transporter [Priestia flexa]MCP1188538.1 MATE family efflux transporter [Priestia flexa]
MNITSKVKSLMQGDFFKKIVDSFFGKVASVAFTMLFSLVCTRLYGAEVFGQYTFAFSIVTLLSIFAKAGFDNGLVYYIPKYGNKYISLSLFLSSIISAVVIIISMFFIEDTFVKWMIPLIWFSALEQIFFGIYRTTDRIKQYFFINGFLALILRIALAVVFYFVFEPTAFYVGVAVYLSFVFSNIIYIYSNLNRIKRINYEPTFVKYSFSLVLAAVMSVAIDRIDTIMLGQMIDMKTVGIFQISTQIATFMTMILIIFDTAFAPQISKLYHSGQHEKLREMYVKCTRLLGLIALAALLFLVTFSDFILSIFGQEFPEGQMVLILKLLGQFINVAVGSVWLMLSMTGRPKFHIYGNLLACSLNIGLNFLLIPHYGMNGAAFASMIAIMVTNIIGYILVARTFKVKVYRFF